MKEITDKSLGIFEEQIKAAKSVWKEFYQGNNNVLLLAEPQQGKTGVALGLVARFLNWCSASEIPTEKIQVLIITSSSDNALRQQTSERFRKAFSEWESHDGYNFEGLEMNKLFVSNHVGAGKKFWGEVIRDSPDVQYRIIILDECHMAINRNGVTHEMLKEMGIDNITQVVGEETKFKPENTCLLHISATPFAQLTLNNSSSVIVPYKTIILGRDSAYMGIPEILESGRFRVYPNYRELVYRYEDRFNASERKAPMVIRASTPKELDEIESTLKSLGYTNTTSLSTNGYGIFEAEPTDNNPISQIDSCIKGHSTSKSKPYVVIIKQAMRAGKTLENYPLIWAESSTKPNDGAWIQSVGRMCTRKVEFTDVEVYMPKKFHREKIDTAVDFYLEQRIGVLQQPILTTTNNSISNQKNIVVLVKKVDDIYSDLGKERPERVSSKLAIDIREAGLPEFERWITATTQSRIKVRNRSGLEFEEATDEDNILGVRDMPTGFPPQTAVNAYEKILENPPVFPQGKNNLLYINPNYRDYFMSEGKVDVWYELEKRGWIDCIVMTGGEAVKTSKLTGNTYLEEEKCLQTN